ncbi:MAG TPA: MarR family transcriptional regulator [Acidimicrobiia bacterium]|nr:MarR family transcriptional regulator [Acidimicrobiia bacterium]
MTLPDAAWTVVHEVRMRGRVDPATIADDVLEAILAAAFAETRPHGIVLTRAGRVAHEVWARVEPGSDQEAALLRSYEAFLPLNRELLALCHDWQLKPGGAPNDHRDARYDWAVIDRLHAFDDRAGGVVRRAAKALDRLAGYRAGLEHALTRVDDGERDWFTSPRIDSYHTVWMHLHEDLLLALGIERASESDARA